MNLILPILGAVLVIGWLVLMFWSWLSPAKPAAESAQDGEHDRQIGMLIGMLGGGIEEAAQARYAISRLEEDLGRRATLHEMATAIGVTLRMQ